MTNSASQKTSEIRSDPLKDKSPQKSKLMMSKNDPKEETTRTRNGEEPGFDPTKSKQLRKWNWLSNLPYHCHLLRWYPRWLRSHPKPEAQRSADYLKASQVVPCKRQP